MPPFYKVGEMLGSELIAKARLKLDDVTVNRYLWSDLELIDCLNKAQNELCSRGLILKDKDTAAICNVAVVAGTAEYVLDSRILFITRARLMTNKKILGFTDEENLDNRIGDSWEDESATPTSCIPDITRHKIRLYPKPILTETLNLTVYRLPATQFTEGNIGSVSTEVPSEYDIPLIDGILATAYLKNDSDTLDLISLKASLQIWEGVIEQAKRDFIRRRSIPRIIAPAKGLLV